MATLNFALLENMNIYTKSQTKTVFYVGRVVVNLRGDYAVALYNDVMLTKLFKIIRFSRLVYDIRCGRYYIGNIEAFYNSIDFYSLLIDTAEPNNNSIDEETCENLIRLNIKANEIHDGVTFPLNFNPDLKIAKDDEFLFRAGDTVNLKLTVSNVIENNGVKYYSFDNLPSNILLSEDDLKSTIICEKLDIKQFSPKEVIEKDDKQRGVVLSFINGTYTVLLDDNTIVTISESDIQSWNSVGRSFDVNKFLWKTVL